MLVFLLSKYKFSFAIQGKQRRIYSYSIVNKCNIHRTIFIENFLVLIIEALGNNTQRNNPISTRTECLEDSRFYRDPKRPVHKIWTNSECSKYYLCLDGEVFNFKCSDGLLFDIVRQICDFKQNVDNCDITSGKPLLSQYLVT